MTLKPKGSDTTYLQDGFQKIFGYGGHVVPAKGFPFEIHDGAIYGESKSKQFYISWDAKLVQIWEKRIVYSPAKVIKRLEFQNKPENYVSSIIYNTKMKVFLMAALDMTFLIYDKQLNLVDSIHHEERAILHMIYIQDKNLIYMGGASGVSIWRMYRQMGVEGAIVMEKMQVIDECIGWISQLIYEPKTNNMYTLMDRSVFVYGLSSDRIVAKLVDIHEAPVTRVCYYGRSQFYITGCRRGLIKCWTSHFDESEYTRRANKAKEKDGDVVTRFALLHVFNCHKDVITGLVLHVVPGLCISSSLDGFIKVLNLEAMSELYKVCINVSILDLKMYTSFSNSNVLFLPLVDGSIEQWKLTSCCNFFGLSTSLIKGIQLFDSLQEEIVAKMSGTTDEIIAQSHNGVIPKAVIASKGSHDLRLFSEKGAVLCHMEPQVVVEGILAYTISVYQEMLFCLMDSGNLRAFCLRTFLCTFLREVPRASDLEADRGNSLTLINQFPSSSMRPQGSLQASLVKDLRGNDVPGYINELVVVGANNGTLSFFDTLNDCELAFITQVNGGCIKSIKFRRFRNELVIMGDEETIGNVNVKVWKLPDMTCTHAIHDLNNITAFDVSPTMSLFGMGTVDGYVRLFQLAPESSACHEVLTQGLTHDTTVSDITFFDALKIYCTCAIDSSVIVWDYQKQVLRHLKFHMPTYSVVFYGLNGDVLITQGYYLLNISRKIWDEGDVLQLALERVDPWKETVTNDFERVADPNYSPKKSIAQEKVEVEEELVIPDEDIKIIPVSLSDYLMRSLNNIETSIATEDKDKVFMTEPQIPVEEKMHRIDVIIPTQINQSDNLPTFNSEGLLTNVIEPSLKPRVRLRAKPFALVKAENFEIVEEYLLKRFASQKVDALVEKELQTPQLNQQQQQHLPIQTQLSQQGNAFLPSSIRRNSNMPLQPTTTPVDVAEAVISSEPNVEVDQKKSLEIAKKFATLGMSPRARLALISATESQDATVINQVAAELQEVLSSSRVNDSYKLMKAEYSQGYYKTQDYILKTQVLPKLNDDAMDSFQKHLRLANLKLRSTVGTYAAEKTLARAPGPLMMKAVVNRIDDMLAQPFNYNGREELGYVIASPPLSARASSANRESRSRKGVTFTEAGTDQEPIAKDPSAPTTPTSAGGKRVIIDLNKQKSQLVEIEPAHQEPKIQLKRVAAPKRYTVVQTNGKQIDDSQLETSGISAALSAQTHFPRKTIRKTVVKVNEQINR